MLTIPNFALVFPLVAWINGTGMIEPVWPDALLEVNVTDTLGMADDVMRCYDRAGYHIAAGEAYAHADAMTAMYCDDMITINGHKADLATPAGQTAFVHELVHWLQEYNGDAEAAECPQALERDAYLIHHEWQRQQGVEVYPDMFTVEIRSMCPGVVP